MASNIDTETVAENLVELLTNSVNMTSVYYDLFLNETPMDITFKQYDDNNKLVEITLPNRAKDRQICKSGTGSPENVVKGNIGECYVDTTTEIVYFKVKNSGDTTGWISALTERSITPILNNYVRTSRTINEKNLGSDIVLSASDVGALPSTTKYGYSLGMTGTNLTLKDQSGNNLSTVVVSALGANQDLSNLSDTGNAKIVPSQSGNEGKYLTTDGTEASWAELSSYHPDIFSFQWVDHLLNNISWLRADTFSWQSGSVYVTAYNTLVEEYSNNPYINHKPILTLVDGVLTLKAGSTVLVPNGFEDDGTTLKFDTVTIASDTVLTTTWGSAANLIVYVQANGSVSWASTDRFSHGTTAPTDTNKQVWYDTTTNLIKEYSSGTLAKSNNSLPIAIVTKTTTTTDTVVGSIDHGFIGVNYWDATKGGNIYFYRSTNGYKIAAPDQEEYVLSKYNSDGIAWFYILDTENKRFKLPRTKWGFKGLRDTVGDDIAESLPNIKGTLTTGFATSATGSQNGIIRSGTGAFYAYGGPSTRSYASSQSTTTSTYNYGAGFDASGSSSTYQDNAPVQERSTQMYLYFYVGEYTQTAIEQTAGLNAELFNGKQDVLVSGTNIKTVNGQSILGSGNVSTYPSVYLKTAYVSGTSGYNIWSNGYCEQWGQETALTSSIWSDTQQIKFSKTFANTNYQVYVAPFDGSMSAGSNRFTITVSDAHTDYCYIRLDGQDSRASYVSWKVSGYLASGQY